MAMLIFIESEERERLIANDGREASNEQSRDFSFPTGESMMRKNEGDW